MVRACSTHVRDEGINLWLENLKEEKRWGIILEWIVEK
jgi:hypothetical protein